MLKPCLHCRTKETCPNKDIILKHLRGLKCVRPTQFSFKCPARTNGLEPGTVVAFTLKCFDLNPEGIWSREDWAALELDYKKGTIMGEKNGKLKIWLDHPVAMNFKEGNVTRIVKLYPDRLTPTGERREICGECGKPLDMSGEAQDLEFGDLERWCCDKCM